MRQCALRGTLWLSIRQENRCSRRLLRGDRVGSGSSSRGLRTVCQRTLEHRAIARHLNQREVPTRFVRGSWERSIIWGMLRNPAYQGAACFGKLKGYHGERSLDLCDRSEVFLLDPALIANANHKSGLQCRFLHWLAQRPLL